MAALRTLVTELFNIDHPIVLAPMGGVSGGVLATAVSKAGGLGLVGASYGNRSWMESELSKVATSGAPWGVGLVMFTIAQRPELLDLALSYRPNVIALSFGDPKDFVSRIHSGGAKAIVQVHEIDQARTALEAGADALIVQGAEAGGHSYKRATFPLIPAVRQAVGGGIALIAAGGVADGRGVAAALALGADGVMVGTRFVASEEALPSLGHKRRLIAASAGDTIRTRAFDVVRGIDWPKAYAGRALHNEFSREWLGREAELAEAPASVRTEYEQAVATDDLDKRAIWAGEIVDIVTDIQPARRIVTNLVEEAVSNITSLGRLVSNENQYVPALG